MTLKLSEEQLRAYIRCSEFYSFGGEVETPMKIQILEYVYIRMVLDILKNPHFDFQFALNANLERMKRQLKLKEIYDVNTVEEYTRHTAINISEIFKLLKPNIYIPAFSTFEYPVRISESLLTMRISSLLVNNQWAATSAAHAVTFSPFTNVKDMENDLVQVIKTMTLAAANPLKPTITGKMKLHIFSVAPQGNLNYTNIDCNTKLVKTWAPYIEAPIKLIESNYHYPVVPCYYSCPYKQQCNIEPNRRRNEGMGN